MTDRYDEATLRASQQVDAISTAFEDTWLSGTIPSLAEFLRRGDPDVQRSLFVELLKLDIEYRSQRGLAVDERRYLDEFPDESLAISAVFRELRDKPLSATPGVADTTEPSVDRNGLVADEVHGKTDPIPHGEAPESRYSYLNLQGQGGMGEVYVGYDHELDREVAVKQIQERFRGLDSSEYDRLQRRFLREARITARLQHPGIAPVYGLGKTETGVLHYAMRLLKGPSLDEVVKKHYDSATNSDEKSHHRGEQSRSTARRLEFRGLIQRVIDVCHTLQYAHDLNVVHRDIKPKNIVTGGYGETIIVDWGLAKLLAETKTDDEELLQKSTREMSDSTDLTQSGVALGTPGYMSPEQARGERQSVGPASDVYSVGATLYMVLTGHNPKPLNASTGTEADAVAEATPAPRSIRSEIPRPLEAICLKAMAIAPQDRYESVSRLASDLERWLADEPVTAYRERLPERMWRTMRRHRSWWILAALALCLVSLSAILSAVLIDGFRRTSVTQRRRTNEALSVLYEYMERTNRSKVRKAL